jgi:hypothetical protein
LSSAPVRSDSARAKAAAPATTAVPEPATTTAAGVRNRKSARPAAADTAKFAHSPDQVFSGFHGRLGPPTRLPMSAAAGSPSASIPHTDPAMAIRWRKRRMRARTAAA